MSVPPPEKSDISRELFFANIQYIFSDRSNLHKLIENRSRNCLISAEPPGWSLSGWMRPELRH